MIPKQLEVDYGRAYYTGRSFSYSDTVRMSLKRQNLRVIRKIGMDHGKLNKNFANYHNSVRVADNLGLWLDRHIL